MNPFKILAGYLRNVLRALGGQLAVKTADFLKQFALEDLGKIAIDAVVYVHATLPDADGVAKRNVAKQKLIADLKAAGHDVEAFAESTLNWLIETALQSVLAGAVK